MRKLGVILFVFLLLGWAVPGAAAQDRDDMPMVMFAHVAPSLGPVDFYVQQDIFLEGWNYGQMSRFSRSIFADSLVVAAGEIEVAVVPAGATLDEAEIASFDVTLEAGHDYFLVVHERLANDEVRYDARVYDLTTISEGIYANEDISPWYLLNLTDRVDVFDVQADGVTAINGVDYLEMEVYKAPLRIFEERFVTTVEQDELFNFVNGYGEPYYSLVRVLDGPYDPEAGTNFLNGELTDGVNADALTYLAALTALDLDLERAQYGTFLELAETVGLADLLPDARGFIFAVPTDAAFAEIPEATFDALMDDPDQLRAVLLSHVIAVEGAAPDITAEFDIETLSGRVVSFNVMRSAFLSINGANILSEMPVSDGIVLFLDAVLLPVE